MSPCDHARGPPSPLHHTASATAGPHAPCAPTALGGWRAACGTRSAAHPPPGADAFAPRHGRANLPAPIQRTMRCMTARCRNFRAMGATTGLNNPRPPLDDADLTFPHSHDGGALRARASACLARTRATPGSPRRDKDLQNGRLGTISEASRWSSGFSSAASWNRPLGKHRPTPEHATSAAQGTRVIVLSRPCANNKIRPEARPWRSDRAHCVLRRVNQRQVAPIWADICRWWSTRRPHVNPRSCFGRLLNPLARTATSKRPGGSRPEILQ